MICLLGGVLFINVVILKSKLTQVISYGLMFLGIYGF
jgi:hypothetical protein